MTRQRAIILHALCELDEHGGAEEVYKRATLYQRDVDLSTVYRTLERSRGGCESCAELNCERERIATRFGAIRRQVW